jgi:hypothetical protein
MSQNWTPPPAGGTATVPNYLVPAILSIICCWPLGIPAIVFATQVNKKIEAGDIQGAEDSSKKAKMFGFIGIGVGILTWIVSIILGISFGLIANTNR